jgi:hypothetical protein
MGIQGFANYQESISVGIVEVLWEEFPWGWCQLKQFGLTFKLENYVCAKLEFEDFGGKETRSFLFPSLGYR